MKFKTRRGKLQNKLEQALKNKVGTADIVMILKIVDEYEKDNLATIEQLKKVKLVTTTKINGALKNTINAHGPITKILIGSATKRIYGSLLEPPKLTIIQRILKKLRIT